MLDLTWTGNQFLNPEQHAATALANLSTLDLTRKEDTWSHAVADAVAAGLGLPDKHVRVGAGATLVLEAVLRSAHRGLLVDVVPTFHLPATIARQEGWHYRPVPVREPGDLLVAVRPYLAREDATIVLSSPRNPLGYQFPVDDIRRLVEQSQGTVVVDEVYADFAPDTALRLTADHPGLVVIRTFSKAWGLANLRVGYAVSAAFAGRLVPRLVPNSVAGVAQQAALQVLARPDAVRDSIRRTRDARDELLAAVRDLPGLHAWPSHANYVCLETPAAPRLVAALADAGIAIRALHDLRGYPADWPAGVRIAVPPQPHLGVVRDVVRRVQAEAR